MPDPLRMLAAIAEVGGEDLAARILTAGLLTLSEPEQATVSAVAEGRGNPCPFTFSHTRDWCGYPLCRAA